VIEQAIYDRLKVLCDGRVWADVAKAGTPKPCITYQQVGGEVVQFTDQTLSDVRHARIMVKAWADKRITASNLAAQIEELLVTHPDMQVVAIGTFISDYEEDTKLYGTRQDFSCWLKK